MYKLIRFYNQNRKRIWLIILIVAFAFGLLKYLNYLAAEKNERERQEFLNNIGSSPTVDIKEEKKKDAITYSVGTGSEIQYDIAKQYDQIISEFVTACNNKDIDTAYSMLSNSCKENLYNTKETFEKIYINNVFEEEKHYEAQLWQQGTSSLTYKMKLYSNPLATGKVDNTKSRFDYYTIDYNKKISISGYIGRFNINSSNTRNGITINVLYKDVYMEYETYKISVENNSENTIMIDSKEKSNSTYLTNNGGTKFSAYMYELTAVSQNSPSSVTVSGKSTSQINIKFNKLYNPSVGINKMVFSDIIIDRDTYQSNKDLLNNRMYMEISM